MHRQPVYGRPNLFDLQNSGTHAVLELFAYDSPLVSQHAKHAAWSDRSCTRVKAQGVGRTLR